MQDEIERRFLVLETGFLSGRKGEEIIQGYLAKEPGGITARVRVYGGRGYLTLKGARDGLRRPEFEYEIPVADARCLLEQHCGARLIRKTRFHVPGPSHVFEVDVFEGRNAGLVIAEVELRREDEAVAMPSWLGPEITGDSRYGNFALSHFEGPQLPPEWRLSLPPSIPPFARRPLAEAH